MGDCESEVSSSTDAAPGVLGVSQSVDSVVLAQAVDSITSNASHMVDGTIDLDLGSDDEDGVHTTASTTSDIAILAGHDGGLSQGQAVLLTSAIDSTCGVSLNDQNTLQSLLSGASLSAVSPGAFQLAGTGNGETIQIIAVSNASDLFTSAGKVWHVLPNVNSSEIATIIVNQDNQNQDELSHTGADSDTQGNAGAQVVDMVPVSGLPDGIGILLPDFQPAIKPPPPGAPTWAARLRDCEIIGDAYRGWVETEVELDLLLTYHKQQTMSFWGTRQSPSPAKQSTRLMWKSQYVPFDGIPFVNSGSRAIVMECQYGPRRKGAQVKRHGDNIIRGEFRQTCPARIYIKKVKKFPDYRVDVTQDKKSLKTTMEKAFQLLKDRGIDGHGQERFYIQLPTEKAHEYHADSAAMQTAIEEKTLSDSEQLCHRLHPKVAQKIRDLVSGGETKLYVIRKALRRFVEKELFENAELVPERHNLTYYPTVNDLQNHIHQAIKDVQAGILPLTTPNASMNVEFFTGHSQGDGKAWQNAAGQPHAETVTVTLTQQPGEDGHHIISRVETHMSDGTTQVSDSLTPETAQLLAKLHPNMFSAIESSAQFDAGSSSRITASLLSDDTAEHTGANNNVKVKDDEDDLNNDILDSKGDPMSAIELQLQDGNTSDSLVDELSEQIGNAQPICDDIDDTQGLHVVNTASVGGLENAGQFIQHPDGSLQLIPSSAFEGHHLQLDDESLKSLELAGKTQAQGLVAIVTEDGQVVLRYNKPDESLLKEEDMDTSMEDDE